MAHKAKILCKIVALTIMGVVLFVAGLVGTIYSGWFQDELRQVLVDAVNKQPGMHMSLDKFRLWMPLRLELQGLSFMQDGDTIIAAKHFDGRVSPLPLLHGTIEVEHAKLHDGLYRMGNRDSATYITVHAGDADISPATVQLNPMKIRLKQGSLDDALVDIYINPNPPKSGSGEASEPSPLNIDVDDLTLRNFTYRMNMLPTIDTLGVNIAEGRLHGAAIDVLKQTIDISEFIGSGLNARYIVPDSATIANTIVAPADTTKSAPWTVRMQTLDFTNSHGLYTTNGYKPEAGLDFGYIDVDSLHLNITNFYNCASTVKLPLNLRGVERCGVDITAAGTLDINDDGMTFTDFAVSTPLGTTLKAEGFLGTGDIVNDNTVPVSLNIDGTLSMADTKLMFPIAKPYLSLLPKSTKLDMGVEVDGNMLKLRLGKLKMTLGSTMSIDASGFLCNVMDAKKLSGDISLQGKIGNVDPFVRMFLAGTGIAIPPMTLGGRIKFDNGNYAGNMKARTLGGDIALDGSWHGRGNKYDIDLIANSFPVGAFMPSLGIGNVTAHVNAVGQGFDIYSKSIASDINLDIASVQYQGKTYNDINGTASIHNGHTSLDITSLNNGLDFSLVGSAELSDDNHYVVTAQVNGRDIDLAALNLSETQARLAINADIDADFSRDMHETTATLRLYDLKYTHDSGEINIDDVTAHLNSTDSVTNASIRNRDLYAYFSAPMGLDSVATRFTRAANVATKQITDRKISVVNVQRELPEFVIDVNAGHDNALNQLLADSDMSFKRMSFEASNDSVIFVGAKALSFTTGETRLDTLSLDINQIGERLNYIAKVGNRPGTLDDWAHVDVDGYFETDKLGIRVNQRNIKGKNGYDVGGALAFVGDSLATLHLEPLNARIGYQDWTINEDNFIKYNIRYRHIDANLHMHGVGSTLAIYSEHAQDVEDAAHGSDEDLIVDVQNVNLQDWISLNPFAPPVKGVLSANMRVNWQDKALTGNGEVSLTDFIYGKDRVGDIKADINILTNHTGLMNADVALWIDGVKSMTLTGALNDSTRTSPLNLDFSMIRFPLSTVNPFIPGVAKLSGMLNGRMDISGDSNKPILNGYLDFDSARVSVDMLGSTLAFSEEQIPVTNNIVNINDFKITACNENPLTINGKVDITELSSPQISLMAKATNMQLVNSSRAPKGADLYGKAFMSLNADVNGNLGRLYVNATADILPGTNVTYVMTETTSAALQTRSNTDMVKFVNFSDTTAVEKADTIGTPETMQMYINAVLNVQSGSTVNVDLSSDGKNRIQLKSQGSLNYTSTPTSSDRLTGRLAINSGFARYTVQVMGEKLFNFNEGSYVAFTGDMMNPQLNISATDQVRANVTQEGQNSRLIYFDVGLNVTGTLNNMDVAFDLSTDDDATVANELASMSKDQRASAAMNLLITNIYNGTETKADANLGGNALYSFLTSQLNSWAASTIRGVDLSFGINQYDLTDNGSTSQATSYSYQVSKSLFNDRFKIVVGGNYTDGTNSEENVAESLVSDVSIEYSLNKNGTMLVKIFRHTGYESILEGEITQTGVGFEYRRKIRRIGDMFRWRRRRNSQAQMTRQDTTTVNDQTLKQ
jgi:hypothetical protein